MSLVSSSTYGIGSGLTASYSNTDGSANSTLLDVVEEFTEGDLVVNLTKAGLEKLLGVSVIDHGTENAKVNVSTSVVKEYIYSVLSGSPSVADIAADHSTHPLTNVRNAIDTELPTTLKSRIRNHVAARFAGYINRSEAENDNASLDDLLTSLDSFGLLNSVTTQIDALDALPSAESDINGTGTPANLLGALADAGFIGSDGTLDVAHSFGVTVPFTVTYSVGSTTTFSADTTGTNATNFAGSLSGTEVTESVILGDSTDPTVNSKASNTNSATYDVVFSYTHSP